ncbi:hypothetical protein KAX17_12640 [Candidatus Bipolaricaulota bacterium]|nr:hypothetical protein [Candidatus Bipolaricaulota bacterium]
MTQKFPSPMRIIPCVDKVDYTRLFDSPNLFPSPMRIEACVDQALSKYLDPGSKVSIPDEDCCLCRQFYTLVAIAYIILVSIPDED